MYWIWFVECAVIKLVLGSNSVVEIPYEKRLGHLNVEIYIGEPSLVTTLEIDMGINYTWVSEFQYDIRNSHTKQHEINTQLHFHNGKQLPTLFIKDKISLFQHKSSTSNIIINNFTFYYIDSDLTRFPYFESIGFAFNNGNPPSLFSALNTNGYIQYNSFTFINEPSNDNKGILIIGDIPRYYAYQFPNTFECSINPTQTNWMCMVEEIATKHNTLRVFTEGIFNVNEDVTLVPGYVIDYFRDEIFNDLIYNNVCFESNTFTKGRTISCKYDIYNDTFDEIEFPEFQITFNGGNVITFNEDNMFITGYGQRAFILLFCENPHSDVWLFGNKFITLFNIEFNYERQSIIFHSKTKFYRNYLKTQIRILKHLSLLMIFTIIILIIFKKKYI